MTIRYDVLSSLEGRRAEQLRTAENSTRNASAAGMYSSHGWGEFRFPKCFVFGLTFIEEPTLAYGYSIDNDTLVDTRFPRSFGFTVRYKIDRRGYFVGAWTAVVVETRSVFIPSTVIDPQYDLNHSFTYSGLAIKDIPEHLADDA